MIQQANCWKRGCAHYIGVSQPDGTELSERHVCTAFPDGIPGEISVGTNKHLKVHPKQTGTDVYKVAKKRTKSKTT